MAVLAAPGVHNVHRRHLIVGLPEPPSSSADNGQQQAGQVSDVASSAAAGCAVLICVVLTAIGIYGLIRLSSRDEQETGGDGRGTQGRGEGGRARRRQADAEVVRTYRTADGWDEEQTCSVCLSEMAHGEAVRVLAECLHCFHAACVEQWLRKRRTCPICRAPVAEAGSRHHRRASI
ncbi:hypothetical protein BS78_03G351000 [Paspalum vaginatum]|nr:hypothetical protein BS78_03G351000 [Paspalum vaginatum]